MFAFRRARPGALAALFACAWMLVTAPAAAQDDRTSAWDEQLQGPLPRWREGGTPPVDPGQGSMPQAVPFFPAEDAPTSGLIESPPEYAPARGVLFRYSSYAWPDVVIDCVAALTGDPDHDEFAYVVVSSSSQQSTAAGQFAAAGADLSRVRFFIMPSDSIWLRDYGPHFIWQSGAQAIADSHYYPTRPLDNFVPTMVGEDFFRIPAYAMGLYYSGGNFQPGPDRSGFTTTLVNQDNAGFGNDLIAELFHAYQGIDTLHIFPRLPYSVDATGHIDMWMSIVDEDTVIISEFLPGSHPDAIEITENAVTYMEGLGFEVFRVPDHNGYHPQDPACHYTYTNAFRVNDRIFIPSYGSGGGAHAARDLQALAAWQAAAPEAEIIPIDCYGIIWAAGAIHCIVMQVPKYVETEPAAHVISPDGGEFLVEGATHDLRWVATDDIRITGVDLDYSLDGGLTFPYEIASGEPNDGHFDWTVPGELSQGGMVRVTPVDSDGNTVEAVSATPFEFALAPQTVYDFTENAGVDRWAWGYQTQSWYSVSGNRYPVIAEVSSSAYQRLALPDADGGDGDPDRYIAPYPTSGRETTHVFEFTIAEDPATILDLGIFWEGYGDDCTQMELYLWDNAQDDWCDGAGQFGENRYMDNFAGNRDRMLERHVRSDFDRVVDEDGLLTFMLYGERQGDRSFHDYVSVIVTHRLPADVNGDGAIDVGDLVAVILAWGPCPAPPQTCPADVNADSTIDVEDVILVILDWS